MVDDRFEYTKKRLAEGISQRQIARELNVDHSTVGYWVKNNFSTGTLAKPKASIEEIIEWCDKNAPHYSYILGSYLGDGYINVMPRTTKIRIYNDIKYSEIIEDQKIALGILFPDNKVSVYKQLNSNCIEVRTHNKDLPRFFPQHGEGNKHERDVSLKDWQWDIVWKEPECFIKGLIDSDGNEHVNTIHKANTEYDYRSYQFTNHSQDIIESYSSVLSHLKIDYTVNRYKSGRTDIFSRTRYAVNKLDKLYEIAENKIRNGDIAELV